MSTATLPISNIVDVTVSVTPQLGTPPAQNQPLFVGSSPVIPSVGANSRVRQYTTLLQMVADGFTTTAPEYLAASAAFGQTPAPPILWIGRQDLTAMQTVAVDAGGAGYAVGDVVGVTQSGASGGFLKVTSETSGVVTGLETLVGQQGTGYAEGTALATTGGSGTGLTINITALGETCLQAVESCRLVSTAWYGFSALNAVDADIQALATWAQSQAFQSSVLGFQMTSDAAVLNNTANNIAETLSQQNISRMVLIYSTTQSGNALGNTYAACALCGLAAGYSTGLAGSFFDVAGKSLTGIVPETNVWGGNAQQYYANLLANNCNVLAGFASAFNLIEPGLVANGEGIAEIVMLDMLVYQLQYNILNALVGSPAIPQTDAGQSQLLSAASTACEIMVNVGFIAPTNRVWSGPKVLNLSPGQALTNGFLTQSASYATAPASQFINGQAMPIYVSIIEAGSARSVTVGVYDQR